MGMQTSPSIKSGWYKVEILIDQSELKDDNCVRVGIGALNPRMRLKSSNASFTTGVNLVKQPPHYCSTLLLTDYYYNRVVYV